METQTQEDVKSMMARLLDAAKKTRESYLYSGDEKMMPMAYIYNDHNITVMALSWNDDKEKYQMAAFANLEARKARAKSLSFVTDSRWVKTEKFCEYYKLDPPNEKNIDAIQRDYHRIRAAHGGEVKNLPREVWDEAVVVFTNGPGIPVQIQMAPYKEGPNDTIEWLPLEDRHKPDGGKSDMLTDWWS